MKRRIIRILLGLLFAPALACPVAGRAGLVPVNLQCESKPNPSGIDEPNPQLSWQVQAADANERGQVQTAYELQVASSLAFLTNGTADLWATGVVATNQTAQLAYAGNALASHQVCFWRVRVWVQAPG